MSRDSSRPDMKWGRSGRLVVGPEGAGARFCGRTRAMIGKNLLSMSGLSVYRSAVQFGLNIAVAAYVTPAEYGLLVFTAPFLAFLALMTDLGLSSAIVRAEVLTAGDAGAAFVLTSGLGLLLAALLALCAFPLAALVHAPGLGPVMAAMSAVVLLSMVAGTPRAMLERRLHYGKVAAVESVAVFVSVGMAIGAAHLGAGVWALVFYNLLVQTLRAAAFGWLARGGFALNLRFGRLRPLVSFGGWVLANNVLTFLARNSDNILIGAYLGSAALGLYGLAYQFMLAPLMAFTWPASAILFATLSRLGFGSDAARRTIDGVLFTTALISLPAMTYVSFGLAYPAHLWLSPRWAGVAPILAWLAPVGALQSISSYGGTLLMSAGRARAQFAYTALNAAVTVTTFLLALPYGLAAMVRAYAVSATVMSLVAVAAAVALTPMTWRAFGAALAVPALASGLGLAAVLALTGTSPATLTAWLTATATFGAVVLGVYALRFGRVRQGIGALVQAS